MLDLDLSRLQSPTRFQQMCFRLALYEFPDAITLSASWDRGRDIVVLASASAGDVVFQCKFTTNLIAAKSKIAASLDALAKNGRSTSKWILCVPVDPSAVFLNWLQSQLETHALEGRVWAKSQLIARLEQHPDVIETFFYAQFSELAGYFRSDHLELFKLSVDPTCQWRQTDPKVLHFSRKGNVSSPDLVLDVIVRNTGNVATAITGIEAEVFDRRTKMHGLPGEGLLLPQITYTVSIHGGRTGCYRVVCDPPLLVKRRDVERFRIRITDTGYAWNGAVRLTLIAGATRRLRLPVMRIFT